MQKVADKGDVLVGTTTPVSLLDFYYLRDYLILVMERPSPSECLSSNRKRKQGISKDEAKVVLI